MSGAGVTVAARDLERALLDALVRAGATAGNAAPVAGAVARAEVEGNRVCGVFYAPIFCEHLRVGKVDGRAVPRLEIDGAALRIDAANGFAHPAIAAGLPPLVEAARRHGIAALSVARSYNALALAHHVRPLAEAGLIGLCTSNAPAAVAPPGARDRLFGTNPVAFAVPDAAGGAIVVDQSMSAVTKTEMVMRARSGTPVPEGWAQDADGRPTTDAATGLAGSLLPSGGQKGANLALFFEILAAALSGSNLSVEAPMFGDNEGGPPGVGQFLLAIDPARFSAGFGERIATLVRAYEAAGVRVPGRRSAAASWQDGSATLDAGAWASILALAGGDAGEGRDG